MGSRVRSIGGDAAFGGVAHTANDEAIGIRVIRGDRGNVARTKKRQIITRRRSTTPNVKHHLTLSRSVLPSGIYGECAGD